MWFFLRKQPQDEAPSGYSYAGFAVVCAKTLPEHSWPGIYVDFLSEKRLSFHPNEPKPLAEAPEKEKAITPLSASVDHLSVCYLSTPIPKILFTPSARESGPEKAVRAVAERKTKKELTLFAIYSL